MLHIAAASIALGNRLRTQGSSGVESSEVVSGEWTGVGLESGVEWSGAARIGVESGQIGVEESAMEWS